MKKCLIQNDSICKSSKNVYAFEAADCEPPLGEIAVSDDIVTDFLNIIAPFKVCTPEEEADYAERIRNGDKKAKDEFISRNLKLVFYAAKKRRNNSSLEFADLISAGFLGLIVAVERFDPSKGKFSTYAMHRIEATMKREEENFSRTIRLPSYMFQLNARVHRARESLRQILEREPELKEIAEEVKCTERQAEKALKYNYSMYSLNNIFGEDKMNEGITFFESEDDVEEAVADKIMSETISKEVRKLLKNLNDNEAKVVMMRHFEQRTFESIGNELGLSKQRVREIECCAMEKLKKLAAECGLQKLIIS